MSTLGVVIFSLEGMKDLHLCVQAIQCVDVVWIVHFGEGEPARDGFRNPPVCRRVGSVRELRALSQEVGTDWVLYLWGEERLEPQLGESLGEILQSEVAKSPRGYRIPIRSFLLQRWVEGSLWEPTPALRLMRRAGSFPMHWWESERRRGEKSTGVLKGWIRDYGSCELTQAVTRVQVVSKLWAEDLKSSGRRKASSITWMPLRVFCRQLLRNGIFQKGLAGLAFAVLAAYATLLAYAKLWESTHVGEKTPVAR